MATSAIRRFALVVVLGPGCVGDFGMTLESPEKNLRYVESSTLNVRAEPSASGMRVGKLDLNDMVMRLDETDGEDPWMLVRPREGSEGWVAGRYLRETKLTYEEAYAEATEPRDDANQTRKWWERAAALCPHDLPTLAALTSVYSSTGRPDKAREVRARRMEGWWCPRDPNAAKNCLHIAFPERGEVVAVEPVQRLWGDTFFMGTRVRVSTDDRDEVRPPRRRSEDPRQSRDTFHLELVATGDAYYGAAYSGPDSMPADAPLDGLLAAAEGEVLAHLAARGQQVSVTAMPGFENTWASELERRNDPVPCRRDP